VTLSNPGVLKGGTIMAKDPACGMDVDEKKAAATVTYNGKTYYFCAEVCKRAFQKDPQKYAD
jgi:Cu+-exporting ATPase